MRLTRGDLRRARRSESRGGLADSACSARKSGIVLTSNSIICQHLRHLPTPRPDPPLISIPGSILLKPACMMQTSCRALKTPGSDRRKWLDQGVVDIHPVPAQYIDLESDLLDLFEGPGHWKSRGAQLGRRPPPSLSPSLTSSVMNNSYKLRYTSGQ